MPAASAACGNRLVSVSPGIGVGLEHVQLAALVEHQVHAAERVEAEQLVRAQRELLRPRGHVVRQRGRADEVGAADLVTRLEVVEVVVARHGLHDRQRLRPVLALQHGDGQVASGHVALEQYAAVVREGRHERAPAPRPPCART